MFRVALVCVVVGPLPVAENYRRKPSSSPLPALWLGWHPGAGQVHGCGVAWGCCPCCAFSRPVRGEGWVKSLGLEGRKPIASHFFCTRRFGGRGYCLATCLVFSLLAQCPRLCRRLYSGRPATASSGAPWRCPPVMPPYLKNLPPKVPPDAPRTWHTHADAIAR